jgi:citrate lyase subunit beta / citryl-CoA lyase
LTPEYGTLTEILPAQCLTGHREFAVRIRSLLYVPVSSERFLAKAHERGADAIILDLEDAVAPAQKDAARDRLGAAVAMTGQAGAVVFVRINSEPERIRRDAEAACRAGAVGLLVPKAREPREIVALAEFLAGIERATGRQPMRLVLRIEGVGAVLDARSIARASPRVFALMTGGEDLATALGAEPTPAVLHVPKLLVHYAARAAGVRSFGLLRTVADYNDLAGIEKSAREARRHGFDGATCVHPAVVPILNEAFSPSAAELDHARALVAAAETATAAGRGAFEFEGRMVDEPVVRRARALIAQA